MIGVMWSFGGNLSTASLLFVHAVAPEARKRANLSFSRPHLLALPLRRVRRRPRGSLVTLLIDAPLAMAASMTLSRYAR